MLLDLELSPTLCEFEEEDLDINKGELSAESMVRLLNILIFSEPPLECPYCTLPDLSGLRPRLEDLACLRGLSDMEISLESRYFSIAIFE